MRTNLLSNLCCFYFILSISVSFAIVTLGGVACKTDGNFERDVTKTSFFKIGILREDYKGSDIPPKKENFIPARSANVYSRQKGESFERLYVGVAEKHKELILRLAGLFSAPYCLLYVLHTSRCDNELARYQNPPLEYDAIVEFLDRFEDYLAHDSRHDLWLMSPEDKMTIVWDRHDVLFIYGPLDRIERFLDSRGFGKGEPLVAFSQHMHYYHPSEYDQAENEVIKYFPWLKFPLQPIDEQ